MVHGLACIALLAAAPFPALAQRTQGPGATSEEVAAMSMFIEDGIRSQMDRDRFDRDIERLERRKALVDQGYMFFPYVTRAPA